MIVKVQDMKHCTSLLPILGALSFCLLPAAAEEPAYANFSLLKFSRAFPQAEEQQVLSRMISNSSSFALTLQITPKTNYTVSSLNIQGLSMTDRLGNNLQPDFMTEVGDKGRAYIDIYSKDTMYGDWVHITGTLHVRLAQGIKKHPMQTIIAASPASSIVPGVDVSYELDNTGTLHIYITGEDSVRKVQGITCYSPDGNELRPLSSAAFTSGDNSFKSLTINFGDKLTTLDVILKTYEGAKEVQLPMNFRVGMTGMLPPPTKSENSRRIAPPKFKL